MGIPGKGEEEEPAKKTEKVQIIRRKKKKKTCFESMRYPGSHVNKV